MHTDFMGLIIFIGIALFFDFLNGFNDSANIVATMISSRAMTPRRALFISGIFEFLGPLLFGVAVATTIGHEVVSADIISNALMFAALLSAIFWSLITWYFGIPSSSSHALIGGLAGSAFMANLLLQIRQGNIHSFNNILASASVIKPHGIVKVVISLLISPILGFVVAFVVIKFLYFLGRAASPKINWFFKKGQLLTAISLALSHGANDAQKTMAIIAMTLFASGFTKEFRVPLWVVLACAAAIALGTSIGGWRQIKTIGGKFYKIRPIHGFTTQVSSGLLIFTASILGGPVSTTHVVSSAVMGAGSAERLSKVRWGVSRQILIAWILTMPITAILASILYLLIWSMPWAG